MMIESYKIIQKQRSNLELPHYSNRFRACLEPFEKKSGDRPNQMCLVDVAFVARMKNEK